MRQTPWTSLGLSLEDRLWGRIGHVDYTGSPIGCWVWLKAKDAAGYGQISVSHTKRLSTHRLAYELRKGAIPKGMDVCHKCDNPSCINPDHLFLGTRKDNAQDASRKHRLHKGYKLTQEQVDEIRRLCGQGIMQKDVAKQFGVSRSAISSIIRGREWK